MADDINIYGPPATGKTRFSEEFKRHYRCNTVFDDGRELRDASERIVLRGKAPFLILTQKPVRATGIRNIHIANALRDIGKGII